MIFLRNTCMAYGTIYSIGCHFRRMQPDRHIPSINQSISMEWLIDLDYCGICNSRHRGKESVLI